MTKKIWKRLSVIVAIAMIIGLAGFANAFVGNPVSKMLAKNTAEKILEIDYKNKDYQIDDVTYSFKDGYYHAKISSPTSIDSYFYLSINMFGQLKYDNYASITDGYNTADRLNEDYRKLTDPIIEKLRLKYKGDIGYGRLEIRPRESIKYENSSEIDYDIPKYVIAQEDLELDKLYDIREFGKSVGYITFYVDTNDITTKNAANILLEIKKEFEEAGAPFKAIDLTLRAPIEETNNQNQEQIDLLEFDTDDIYEEGLVERVKKADKEAKEYYAKLDQQKLEEEKNVE